MVISIANSVGAIAYACVSSAKERSGQPKAQIGAYRLGAYGTFCGTPCVNVGRLIPRSVALSTVDHSVTGAGVRLSVPSELQQGCLRQQWAESARAQHVVEAMRELGERLRKEVLAIERGGTVHRAVIDELNHLMAEHPMLTRLKVSGSGTTTELWFDPQRPDDLFAPLAHSASALFSGVDRNRVRKCGQCVLHFHDTSKKGTRRWCSMQLCGNRLKVAAYAARRRTIARN